MPEDAPVNTGAPDQWPRMGRGRRVSGMQTKLHRWAAADPGRRFDDLFNFVHDPATLLVAFDRVAGNTGANTPGVDGGPSPTMEDAHRVSGFLDRPASPVERRLVPAASGAGTHDSQTRRQRKVRRLGIPTIADRVVQAALKLVLEPIFEADFAPVLLWVSADAARARRGRGDSHARHQGLSLGAGRGYRSVFGCFVTLLLSLIVMIKTDLPGWLGAGYAGLFGVRCGRGRLAVRRA